jgi:hypothetical protein
MNVQKIVEFDVLQVFKTFSRIFWSIKTDRLALLSVDFTFIWRLIVLLFKLLYEKL